MFQGKTVVILSNWAKYNSNSISISIQLTGRKSQGWVFRAISSRELFQSWEARLYMAIICLVRQHSTSVNNIHLLTTLKSRHISQRTHFIALRVLFSYLATSECILDIK
jgi:hypothetical protein